jgi:parvulin-like peptidyl-prolyl isomerase
MAKAKAKVQAAARPVSRHRREVEAERMNRILIVGGVVAVIAIAVGVIIFGWYQTQVKPLTKTVLTVEGTKYNLSHVVRRMELERNSNNAYDGQAILNLADDVLDRLELEGKVLAAAGELNVTVTDEDVANEIKNRGDLAEDVEASVFATELNRQLDQTGLKKNEYEQMIRAEIAEERIRNYFNLLAPASEPQIRAQWLATDSKEKLDEALSRLAAGGEFGEVSEEFSISAALGPGHGDLDWTARGGSFYVPQEAQDYLFAASTEAGDYSDGIEAGNLFYVVKLLEREDDRPLDETQRRAVAGREYFEWLDALNATLKIERDFTDDDEVRALDRII